MKKYYEYGNHPWNYGLKGAQKWTSGQKEKYYNSLNKNGWYRKSKAEQKVYLELVERYGESDVICQYSKDERYPFNCDFYVKSKDLFIEVNSFWHHGPHRFDENNEKDIELLKQWEEKAKSSQQYKNAINTWTIRDKNKIETAKKNNLNYITIYN